MGLSMENFYDFTSSRRGFLKATGIVAATSSLALPQAVHAAETDETIRVGLIGCGARGTGAAINCMNADKNVKIVALGNERNKYLAAVGWTLVLVAVSVFVPHGALLQLLGLLLVYLIYYQTGVLRAIGAFILTFVIEIGLFICFFLFLRGLAVILRHA